MSDCILHRRIPGSASAGRTASPRRERVHRERFRRERARVGTEAIAEGLKRCVDGEVITFDSNYEVRADQRVWFGIAAYERWSLVHRLVPKAFVVKALDQFAGWWF